MEKADNKSTREGLIRFRGFRLLKRLTKASQKTTGDDPWKVK